MDPVQAAATPMESIFNTRIGVLIVDVKISVLNGRAQSCGPRRGDGTAVERQFMGGGRTDPSRSPTDLGWLVLALENRSRSLTSPRWPRWQSSSSVSYTHLRAHETGRNLVCRLLL